MTSRSYGRGLLRELGPTATLAVPVVLAEVGWVFMGIVDTLIVGRLGAEAIGAVGVGSMLFFTVAVFGMGMLLGLDPLVSQAFGAGQPEECRRSLVQGLYLALALGPPLTIAVIAASAHLGAVGVHPTVAHLAGPYLEATAWSMGPLLLFAAFRRYLQATDRLGPILFALISANVINALANWILVFGHLGAPALGVRGSGWATTASRGYMAAVIAMFALADGQGRASRFVPRLDLARLRELVALGFPAAMQATLEVGVFALATTLAGRFAPTALAAHQIVLNVASLTFMIPLGLASAAAVRVGHAIGRGDPEAGARAGTTAIALGAVLMMTAGLTFLLVPRTIVAAFTNDPNVTKTGLTLFVIAACFQLFDGLQGVATGALRGAGDTRSPMVVNLLAHWALGLPTGYFLAFHQGLGVFGLWIGLSLGLAVTGIVLVWVWIVRTRTLKSLQPAAVD